MSTNEQGRWDETAEFAYFIGSSLIGAAREVGIDPDLIKPLAVAFNNQFSAKVNAARQTPTGPDGMPV